MLNWLPFLARRHGLTTPNWIKREHRSKVAVFYYIPVKSRPSIVVIEATQMALHLSKTSKEKPREPCDITKHKKRHRKILTGRYELLGYFQGKVFADL